jgi:predicted anti-sigma-YlaC factor YlaD
MPNCKVYRHWMSLKLDGLLNEKQERALQAHLATCAACRDEWEAMQFVSHLLDEQPMIPAPPGFVARVEHRLAAERVAKRRGVMGAAALALGTLSLVTLGLSSLAGFVFQLWPLLRQPSLWDSLQGWLTQVVDVCLAIGQAIALLLGSLFDFVGGPILLVYILAVLLLTALWSRLVFRRVRAYRLVVR